MLSRSPGLTPCRLLAAGFLAVGFAAFLGCGPDYKARGVVKGKVTANNVPLTSGTVMFTNKNGISSSASIDTEGNYVMNDAPVGECTITVTVSAPSQMGGPDFKKQWTKMVGSVESKDPEGNHPSIPIMGKMPAKIVQIDQKYSKAETSGLSFTVEKGEQVYNIQL